MRLTWAGRDRPESLTLRYIALTGNTYGTAQARLDTLVVPSL